MLSLSLRNLQVVKRVGELIDSGVDRKIEELVADGHLETTQDALVHLDFQINLNSIVLCEK
jgi:hypothetical protein